jgi:hypothetical protein
MGEQLVEEVVPELTNDLVENVRVPDVGCNRAFPASGHYPSPRSANAPSFDGRNPTDFLSILKQHGHRAGLTKDELAPYILQYCTKDMKHVMRYLLELSPTANSWAEAEEEINGLYGSEDRPTCFSINNLRSFCVETHAKQVFRRSLGGNWEHHLSQACTILVREGSPSLSAKMGNVPVAGKVIEVL